MFSDIDPWTNRPYESAGPSNAGSQFPANPGPTGGASVPSNSAFGGRGTNASRNRYGLGDFRNYRSTAPVNVESDEELNTGPGAPASAPFAPRRENVAPVTIDEIAARARVASRSAPRFEVPAFEEGDDPQAYVEYFEDECNAYSLDINMKKSALKKAILEANKKAKQRTYWRNFIQAKPSYAQMKREFIDYYEDYVKAERDWDSALRSMSRVMPTFSDGSPTKCFGQAGPNRRLAMVPARSSTRCTNMWSRPRSPQLPGKNPPSSQEMWSKKSGN